jgi:hypothetical protein
MPPMIRYEVTNGRCGFDAANAEKNKNAFATWPQPTKNPQRGTKVPLYGVIQAIEFPSAGKNMCEELKTLKREAAYVLRAVKSIRRSRDLSFYEDAELNREKHHILNAVLKHLLAGHGGKPCPAGDRPIVSLAKTTQLRR